jgi:hypothetical protein
MGCARPTACCDRDIPRLRRDRPSQAARPVSRARIAPALRSCPARARSSADRVSNRVPRVPIRHRRVKTQHRGRSRAGRGGRACGRFQRTVLENGAIARTCFLSRDGACRRQRDGTVPRILSFGKDAPDLSTPRTTRRISHLFDHR